MKHSRIVVWIVVFVGLGFLSCCSPLERPVQRVEYYDDEVFFEFIAVQAPLRLETRAVEAYQMSADYRHSYIFVESFEEDEISIAFDRESGARWETESDKRKAKDGNNMKIFSRSLSTLNERGIVESVSNWMILGPFDLSATEEADFSFYFQLGDVEEEQSASLLVLVSTDGSAFFGYKFYGATFGWAYQNLELKNIPGLGNVCNQDQIWIAFVPGVPPEASDWLTFSLDSPAPPQETSEGEIALDHLRFLATNSDLNPRVEISEQIPQRPSMPDTSGYSSTGWQLPQSASHREIAEWYSPVIHQDLIEPEYGDYITKINYDGDFVGNNNWDNLGRKKKTYPLPAYVYYSVIETYTHYFICYALFHPADDFKVNIFRHENDLEGILMCVAKDGSQYGQLRMVQLQAHNDFFQFKAPYANGIYDRNEDNDNVIELDTTHPGIHPRVYVEAGGHGIRFEDTGNQPSAVYYYTGVAQDPDDVTPNSVGYDLLSIFEDIWQRKNDCCGCGELLDGWGFFHGSRFLVTDLGTKFDGDDGADDAASTPWHWNDNDDPDWMSGSAWKGEWFMDPAAYLNWQFRWDEDFSIVYTDNLFLDINTN